jgi:hypothetical protein
MVLRKYKAIFTSQDRSVTALPPVGRFGLPEPGWPRCGATIPRFYILWYIDTKYAIYSEYTNQQALYESSAFSDWAD